jgi:hypothetical protein
MALVADKLLAEARERTGLSDFGGTTFMPGLETYLSSLASEAKLTEQATAQVKATILRRLENRLHIEEWYKVNNGATDPSLTGPVFIIGLPRSGTTAIGNILSLNATEFRPLRMWEQRQPVPPPVLETESTDPRRLAYAEEVATIRRERPDLAAMHLWETDAAVEDIELLGLESRNQELPVPVFSYHRWWREADARPAFLYHRRVVSLLQSRRPPNRWLFKSPYHCFHTEEILNAYPDAKFIWTHRDPVKSVVSNMSFLIAFSPASTETHNPKTLGPHYSEHLRIGLERCMAARSRIGEEHFCDVYQTDLTADPIGTAARVYEFLRLEFGAAERTAVAKWDEVNHSGAHGVHNYTAEEYGLHDDQIRSDYAFYTDAYGILNHGKRS